MIKFLLPGYLKLEKLDLQYGEEFDKWLDTLDNEVEDGVCFSRKDLYLAFCGGIEAVKSGRV